MMDSERARASVSAIFRRSFEVCRRRRCCRRRRRQDRKRQSKSSSSLCPAPSSSSVTERVARQKAAENDLVLGDGSLLFLLLSYLRVLALN